MRQAEKKTVVKTLTATNIEWGKLVSRAVLIGGGMVAPMDVSVANGYSATEDLIKVENTLNQWCQLWSIEHLIGRVGNTGFDGKNVGKHFLVLFEIKNCHIWWKRRHDQKKYKKRRPHRIFVNWICYAVIISLWFTYTTRSEKVVTSRQILSTKNRKTGMTFVFCQKSKMCITSFVKVGNNFHFIIKITTTEIFWGFSK